LLKKKERKKRKKERKEKKEQKDVFERECEEWVKERKIQ